MSFGSNIIWRYAQQRDKYSICDGISLDDGFVLTSHPTQVFQVSKDLFYKPLCYNSAPVLSTFKRAGISSLPLFNEQWAQYTDSEPGSFKYSIYPIIYSLTVSTVISIFLTIIVFTNHTQKPSWLLKIGSVLASVNLFILFVRSIIFLNIQHGLGISSGEKLLDDLQSDQVFNVIDFIFVIIAQFAQVQILIRLFSRLKEKRVSFILGGTLSICAQVIWGVATFATFDQSQDSDISILPAFIYLLRIAMATMYSGMIVIYAVSKRNHIFNRNIILLSILTFILIHFQIGLFITDVANVWVSELSEIFNSTIYVTVTVIPWEWINRVHALERHEQTEGILGRPVYEDEYKDIVRYEIVGDTTGNGDDNDENNFHNSNNDNGNNPNDHHEKIDSPTEDAKRNTPGGEGRKTPLNDKLNTKLSKKFKQGVLQSTNALLYFTDQLIAYGLAIPRSVSVGSTVVKENNRQKKQANRKEVFVYSKREVVFHDEEEDGDEDEIDDDLDREQTGSSSKSLGQYTSGDKGPDK